MEIVNLHILAIISVLTTLTTECIKTFCKKTETAYFSNIIAAVVSIVISTVVCVIYPMIMNGVVLSAKLIFEGLVMAFFSVLCATLSYQKVIEALEQLKVK